MAGTCSCCKDLFRCLFIFFNVIFALCGFGVMALGVFLLVYPQAIYMQDLIQVSLSENATFLRYSLYILIAFGGFVVFVAACACCGAGKCKSPVLLGIYIFCVLIIVLGLIGTAVVAGLFKAGKLDVNPFKKELLDDLQKEYRPGRTKYTQPWDHVQVWFDCCGVNNYKDYRPVYESKPGESVPITCCKLTAPVDPDDPKAKNLTECQRLAATEDAAKGNMYLNVQGCVDFMFQTLTDYSTAMIVCPVIIAVVMIIGIIIACCICKDIRRSKKLT